MDVRDPQASDEVAGQHDVPAPVLIAAICDRLADLKPTQAMQARYDVAVASLIACDGGRVAAIAKLHHLRKRLCCQQQHLGLEHLRDLALLDAAIDELTSK